MKTNGQITRTGEGYGRERDKEIEGKKGIKEGRKV
jgi:hypothetical protein